MRATYHNARVGKNGVFSTKHNDRNFNLENANHIDKEKSSQNFYWNIYQNPDLTFEEVEQAFYEKNFSKAVEEQNAKYRKQGNTKKCKTIEQYRKSPRTCPEETQFQIGTQNEHVQAELLHKLVLEQICWERQQFPNVQYIDYALHVDEATPHIQARRVWVANGKVSQTEALKLMGLEQNGKKTRYNNPKVIYTALCREHWETLCRQNNIELETDRLEISNRGLTLTEYKRRQEELKLANIQAQVKEAEQSIAYSKEARKQNCKQALDIYKQKQELDKQKQEFQAYKQAELDKIEAERQTLKAEQQQWHNAVISEKLIIQNKHKSLVTKTVSNNKMHTKER